MAVPRRVRAVLVGAIFTGAAQAADPTAQEQFDAVQHDLNSAREQGQALEIAGRGLHREIARLQAAEIATAKTVQATEAEVSTHEQDLAELERQAASEAKQLAERRGHETAILEALERVATTPPALVALAPGSPVDVARGGILMGAAAPALQTEVQALASTLRQLRETEDAIAAQREALLRQRQTLAERQQQLADLLQQRHVLEGENTQKLSVAQERVNALVAEAATLKQAVDQVDRAKATQEATTPAAAPAPIASGAGPAGGRLVSPAAGEVIKRFGQEDGASTAKGISIATRAAAQIVAPAGGEVLFAGPFKGYGQILIIDHGGGYHSLLAGLGTVECVVGQHVAGGEPVGTMPAEGTPALYLEIRRQNQPVDPAPWLGLRDQKASG